DLLDAEQFGHVFEIGPGEQRLGGVDEHGGVGSGESRGKGSNARTAPLKRHLGAENRKIAPEAPGRPKSAVTLGEDCFPSWRNSLRRFFLRAAHPPRAHSGRLYTCRPPW